MKFRNDKDEKNKTLGLIREEKGFKSVKKQSEIGRSGKKCTLII